MIGVEVRLPDGQHRITVRNMNERDPGGATVYRVIVDDGEDVFVVHHHRSDGYETLLSIVFGEMGAQRRTRARARSPSVPD